MRDFYINPLSANEQCHTLEQAAEVVKNIIDCIDDLWPAIQKERIKLIYDKLIEERSLIKDQHIASTLNSFSKADELAKRWYIYTRNQAIASDERLEVTIHAEQAAGQVLKGQIPSELLNSQFNWLSLGRAPIHEAAELLLKHTEKQITVKNAYHPESLKRLVPQFVPSDKHGQTAYVNANGEKVSPMALSTENAQRLLLVSVENGGSRWAFLKEQNKYFCFKPTHNNLSEYHGFEVERHELHAHVLEALSLPT